MFDNFEESVSKINVYIDGDNRIISRTDIDYNAIMVGFLEMLEGHQEMPAFGVSIHNETIEAMRSGIWIEFIFDNKKSHNGMPYERLLIQVNEEYSGFNVIRFNDGVYEGRCFYINLVNKSMDDFYRTLQIIFD